MVDDIVADIYVSAAKKYWSVRKLRLLRLLSRLYICQVFLRKTPFTCELPEPNRFQLLFSVILSFSSEEQCCIQQFMYRVTIVLGLLLTLRQPLTKVYIILCLYKLSILCAYWNFSYGTRDCHSCRNANRFGETVPTHVLLLSLIILILLAYQ